MPKKNKNNRTEAERKNRMRIAQHQKRMPGRTQPMIPEPEDKMGQYLSAGKLLDRVAIVTGGDSGIGRAVAIGLAKEGADIAIVYLEEDADAKETRLHIENAGRKALLIRGDISREAFCKQAIEKIYAQFGKINILVNNAAEQHPKENIEDIDAKQLRKTFDTNFFSMLFMCKHALKYMREDGAIINTASITAYEGSPHLLDYSATKGAIVSFTRSLSGALIDRKIRVNAVAPGPIWTPLIPSTFKAEEVEKFGNDVPMKRAGQPNEVAPAFIFLASDDASYITGQTIHVNGGIIING
jgi:NAD(P)-dependent dehydrogenase (short-subunit alcohol dehydrogenase family)